MIERVVHAELEVPDVDASVAFYEEFVGLQERERIDGRAYLACREQHHELVLRPSASGEARFAHVAFEVTPGTIEEVAERAANAGASSARHVDEPGVEEAVQFEAPGGFGCQLVSGITMEEVPAPTPLPRPLWFSHVNLAAPDVAELGKFLVSGLGMAHSDWLGPREDPFLAWFHCDVRGALHHGIAIIKKPERGLHHLTFDFAEMQTLGDRADHYTAKTGKRLVWGMGRHGAGGSLFTYVEDPGNVMVELGNGMIRCDGDPRWDEPEVWEMSDFRGADLWGSDVPPHWVAKHVPLAVLPAVAA